VGCLDHCHDGHLCQRGYKTLPQVKEQISRLDEVQAARKPILRWHPESK